MDGKLATHAPLTLVDGIAVDAVGQVYISHRSKNRIRRVDANGIISTVAGSGRAGFAGDNGPAIKAELNFPAGLTFDKAGNLYIADRNNHRVRKIDTKGIITTVAGSGEAGFGGDGGSALLAQLNFPSDVAVDKDGNLFIADRSNNRIRRVDHLGNIKTVVGLGVADFGGDYGPATDALLKYPFGIEVDSSDNLYIADRGNNRVRKVDSKGIITTFAGDGSHSFSGDYGPAFQSSLAFPTDVAVADDGVVYIADRNNNRIRKVDTNGVITTFMGTGKPDYNGDLEIGPETNLYLPLMISIDRGQRLLIADRSNFRVRSIDLKRQSVATIAGNGESLFKGDGGPGTGATLDSPSGIVIDSKGNVLFADKQHNRIRKIDKNGYISTFAGNGSLGNEGNGGPALDAALFLPSQMAIDGKDRIYFASRSGNGWIIRKIDSDGIITHFAGNGMQGKRGDGGPATEASFHSISDIVADEEGRVYVSDFINNDIRKIDLNGVITSVTKDQFEKLGAEVHPNGLAVGANGELYVSDAGSSKIRRITAGPQFITVAGNGDFSDSGNGGPALQAGVRSPGGLVYSPKGELYFAEEQSNYIRKIDVDGNVVLVAGIGEAGHSGDGGPATQARLKGPYRLALDDSGNLYFTDRDNNKVRRINTDGTIETVAGNENIGWMQDGLSVVSTVHNFP